MTKKSKEYPENILKLSLDNSLELRSKNREFHGLQKEFQYFQSQMLLDYTKSKDMKHPRDVGDSREGIFKRFLTENRLIPSKYSISNESVRVVSTEGFFSKEIDILLYDGLNAITLMRRENNYVVYPIEICYGVIQVKSKLTKKELKEAFDNIGSFKKLKKSNIHAINFNNSNISNLKVIQNGVIPPCENGFGIVFAYDTNLKWESLCDEIKELSSSIDKKILPNAIFILNQGFFIFGNEKISSCLNQVIETIDNPVVYGFPDGQNECLYHCYSIINTLLKNSKIVEVPIEKYFSLPLISETLSYSYSFRHLGDHGTCNEHGIFLKKISEEKLKKVLSYCKKIQPINYWSAIMSAYGEKCDEEHNQQRMVWLYNPENLPLHVVVACKTSGGLLCDEIICEEMTILIPFYYSLSDDIINMCPYCKKSTETAELLEKLKVSNGADI